MVKKRNTTSVIFAKHIEPIKNRLTGIYGLSRVVSTGIWLFSKLSPEEQQIAIREAMCEDDDTKLALNYLNSLPDNVRNEVFDAIDVLRGSEALSPEHEQNDKKTSKGSA